MTSPCLFNAPRIWASSVEPDVIKQLDQIRIENKLPSMEALRASCHPVRDVNWEDFKNNIRNGLLTKKVISSEVGSHINISKDEIQKYYDEHKAEFMRPEQVALRSIEVNTAGKDEADVAELRKKAETARKRIHGRRGLRRNRKALFRWFHRQTGRLFGRIQARRTFQGA